MGRPAEGWKLKRPKGRRCFSVVFTHNGERYDLGTGQSEEPAAARRAAELYAETVAGIRQESARQRGAVAPRQLGPVSEGWLNSIDGTIDPETAATYALHLDRHIEPFFRTVERATSLDVQRSYIQKRLKEVQRETIKREFSTLRGLLRFAHDPDGRLEYEPVTAKIPLRAVGKVNKRRTRTPISPDEAAAILALLPETRKLRGQDRRVPVRARYVVAYETSLRPKALRLLSVPENYTKGATHLVITSEIDKARFGRTIPLSAVAQKALEAVAPEAGAIFGKYTNRKWLRRAARAVIGADRARTFHPYDLRAAFLTHLAESGDLAAAQWMAGHKKISTTAIYVQASLRAAESALAKREKGNDAT